MSFSFCSLCFNGKQFHTITTPFQGSGQGFEISSVPRRKSQIQPSALLSSPQFPPGQPCCSLTLSQSRRRNKSFIRLKPLWRPHFGVLTRLSSFLASLGVVLAHADYQIARHAPARTVLQLPRKQAFKFNDSSERQKLWIHHHKVYFPRVKFSEENSRLILWVLMAGEDAFDPV